MRKIFILCTLCVLFCCNNKSKQNIKPNNEIISIHLSRTRGMIDMTKNIYSKYYSIEKNKIYVINELSNPNGKILKTDTIQIIRRDNSKIFNELNNQTNLNSYFSEGLQDDSGGWGFALYYLDKKEKNFSFASSDKIPKYAKNLYDLFNLLEKNK